MYAFALLLVFSLQTNDTLNTSNSYRDSLSVDHVLEIEKLDLESEKLAFDKRRFEKSVTFINRNSGVIITGFITIRPVVKNRNQGLSLLALKVSPIQKMQKGSSENCMKNMLSNWGYLLENLALYEI